MVRPYTVWKKTRVQFSLKNACANNFTLDPNEVKKKKKVCNLAWLLPLGPMIVTGHCEIN